MIRPALVADAEAITKIHVAAWRSAYRGLFPDAYLDGLSEEKRAASWRDALARDAESVLVACPGGIVSGWISFGPSRDGDERGQSEVYALYVDPSAQRRGLGRWLISEAEYRLKGATQRILVWVLKGNLSGRRFYASWGYVLGGQSKEITRDGTVLRVVRYRKSLVAPRAPHHSLSSRPQFS